jgi:glutamate-1-semialdehyde 2,1-aminomutase
MTLVTPSATESLLAEAALYAPGGVNTSQRVIDPMICVRRAEGAYVEDVDGRRYLDYHAAFGPFILGHCHPAVVDAVTEAIRDNDLSGVGVTELEVELARAICTHVPSAEQVLLCNSGSEATFHAIRLARGATGRRHVVKFQGCYHGFHDYVLRNVISTPDRLGKVDALSAGMLPEAITSTLVCRFNDIEDVRSTVAAHAGDVAAIILEPIPHNVGCILPDPEFLRGLRELCDREGIVLIFDEVITGFRHHIGGYQAVCGVTPDLTTMAKGMANGFPIAAVAGRRTLMQRFNTAPGGDVFFAGTYNGHVVGLAAALATLRVLENEPVHDHVFRLGQRLRDGLQEIADAAGVEATAAGFGSVFLLYFMSGPIRSYEDLLRNDAELFVEYRKEMIRRGIFELPTNLKRSHVSYSHTDEDVERTLEAAEESLRTILDRRSPAR